MPAVFVHGNIFTMKKIITALTLLLPLLLAGCSSGPSNTSNNGESSALTSTPGTPVAVTSVSLNKSSMDIYTDDSSASLEAVVLPEEATNKAVTWSSSNTSVATIEDGKITPVSAGSTVITVTTVDGNKTSSCTVNIKDPVTIPNYVLHGLYDGESDWTDKSMILNPYSTSEYMILGVTLHAEDVFKIHMYGDSWYGYSAVKSSVKVGLVSAASSDDNIRVRNTGVYDIYCDYNESDNGHIYISRVDESTPTPSVVNVSGISLNRTGKYMVFRHEYWLTATVYPSNATNQNVTWRSSDESIATVTSLGKVIAQSKRGSATITATTEDGRKTASCLIYVSASEIPDYYLTGTVGGYSRTHGNYIHAAIPLSTGRYLIPDLELVAGDEITITGNNGARLKNKYNQVYVKTVDENMSCNAYLNINDSTYNYLTFEAKASQ